MKSLAVSLALLSMLVNCGKQESAKPVAASTATVVPAPSSSLTSWQSSSQMTSTSVVALPVIDSVLSAEMKSAVDAFSGKTAELKGFKINGHIWNIKNAKIMRNGDVVEMEGQISHVIPSSPDDQANYRMRFNKNICEKFEISYEVRNWIAIAQLLLPIADQVSELPVPATEIEKLGSTVDTIAFKDWKEQAKVMALRLGVLTIQQLQQTEQAQ